MTYSGIQVLSRGLFSPRKCSRASRAFFSFADVNACSKIRYTFHRVTYMYQFFAFCSLMSLSFDFSVGTPRSAPATHVLWKPVMQLE